MSPVKEILELVLFALSATVIVAALATLLIVIRLLAAIRSYVGILVSMPDVIPQINVNPVPTQQPASAPAPGPWPFPGWSPDWARAWAEQWGGGQAGADAEPSDVRSTPPYPGDNDDFRPGPLFTEPAANSKARQDLEEEEEPHAQGR